MQVLITNLHTKDPIFRSIRNVLLHMLVPQMPPVPVPSVFLLGAVPGNARWMAAECQQGSLTLLVRMLQRSADGHKAEKQSKYTQYSNTLSISLMCSFMVQMKSSIKSPNTWINLCSYYKSSDKKMNPHIIKSRPPIGPTLMFHRSIPGNEP